MSSLAYFLIDTNQSVNEGVQKLVRSLPIQLRQFIRIIGGELHAL